MSQHTPGPWEYLPTDGAVVTQESDFGAREIAWSDADYCLIAAAPDLLAALGAAVRTIRTWHGMGMGAAEAQAWSLYQASPEMQQINAAITKAEGVE